MKGIWRKYLAVLILALAFAGQAFGDESKRGFYEGDIAGGGKIVFFVQGNHAISAYFFDVAGQQSGFAGGGAGNNGTFHLKTNKQLTISGTITDTESGVDAHSLTFSVRDEYGEVQPAGAITLGAGGTFSFTVSLRAARQGSDRDGRRYTVVVRAEDNAGNQGSSSAVVTVPHDRRD